MTRKMFIEDEDDQELTTWRRGPKKKAPRVFQPEAGLSRVVEQAKEVALLAQQGQSEAQIAKKVGHSVEWVTDTLELASAPEELLNAVRDGFLSRTAALQVMQVSPEQLNVVLGEAIHLARQRFATL